MKKAILLLVVVLLSKIGVASVYPVGYVWDRTDDWTAGMNPDDDSYGNSAWSYEYYRNISYDDSHLGGSNPWYNYGMSNCTWRSSDSMWICPDLNGWPGLSQQRSLNSAQWTGIEYAFAYRWTNPSSELLTVDVKFGENSLFKWLGYDQRYNSAPIDLAVLLVDESSNTTSLIYGNTYSPDTSSDVWYGFKDIAGLSIDDVEVDVMDQIIVTWRPTSNVGFTAWDEFRDDLEIHLVPEPASLIMLGLGGLLIRKRK